MPAATESERRASVYEAKRDGAVGFDEHQHPRDKHGRFIQVGGSVTLWGGGHGTVTRELGGGRIEVQKDDGTHVNVDAAHVVMLRSPSAKPPPKSGGNPPNPPHASAAEAPTPPGKGPKGAFAVYTSPDGHGRAWLRTDEGAQPVGYIQTNVDDPHTLTRYPDAEKWAADVAAARMVEDHPAPLAKPAAKPAGTPDASNPLSPAVQSQRRALATQNAAAGGPAITAEAHRLGREHDAAGKPDAQRLFDIGDDVESGIITPAEGRKRIDKITGGTPDAPASRRGGEPGPGDPGYDPGDGGSRRGGEPGPGDPGYDPGTGSGLGADGLPAPQRVAPLTDEEYAAHTAFIEQAVAAALTRGLTTDRTHTLAGGGQVYKPERVQQHKEVIDELWAAADSVPSEGKSVMAGGLGGAGKSTTLKDYAGIDPSQWLTINPDDVKAVMSRKGMVPQVEGLSDMEASALIHEESSHITNLLARRAYAERKNVVWDITMSSQPSVEKRVAQMRDAGYADIQGVFVDIPVETSVERAMSRHRRGLEAYRNGQGEGGRYVPPAVIRQNASVQWSSANRGNFEASRPLFDDWQVWDNSVNGRAPQLLGSARPFQPIIIPPQGAEAGASAAPVPKDGGTQ